METPLQGRSNACVNCRLQQVDEMATEFHLPLEDFDAVEDLEGRIAQDPAMRRRLVAQLSHKTSSDITKSTYDIMAALCSNYCGTLFTWHGTGTKKPFYKLAPTIVRSIKGIQVFGFFYFALFNFLCLS